MDIQITTEHEDNIHLHPSYIVELLPLFGATGEQDFNGYLITITVVSSVLGDEHTTESLVICRALPDEPTASNLARAMVMASEVVNSVDKKLRNSGISTAHLN
jgi:hypothetical protein